MARKVKWTEIAWGDLVELFDYIAKDSHYYAAGFVSEVRDAARSLSYMAERGRVVPEFGDPTIRELFIKRYRLIYQVRERNVYIIGLVHGARDLLAFWEREKRPNLEHGE